MWRSFFRDPGQPKAGKEGGLGEGTELRWFQPWCSGRRLQARNARIAIAEPSGFIERDQRAARLTFERIAGRKVGMDKMEAPVGAPCLLQPPERLVGARFKQMHRADLPVPGGQIAITRTKADCIFR